MDLKLELVNVSKKVDKTEILHHINCCFNEGINGILGANGAGKTTLLNLIINNKKYKGDIFFNNKPFNNININEIGFLPQDFNCFESFSAIEFMDYMAILKGVSKESRKEECEYYLSLVGLNLVSRQKINTFSGGMKQRLGIAQALLNNPKILIFDEPTVGLDPKERLKFRNMLSQLSQNRIVIFSSHIVSDIEEIASSITIIKKGRIEGHGNMESLLLELEGKIWEFVEEVQEKFKPDNDMILISENTQKEKKSFRVYSPIKPYPNAVLVEPKLEDLYIYHFRDEVK
ncbi:ABC transporter ATP-binding protein [Streptococcus uberis]